MAKKISPNPSKARAPLASRQSRDSHLADCLRHFAWKMCDNPENYTQEEGKLMDRALRSCPGIIDIDRVWIRWGFIGEKLNWSTRDELTYNWKTGYSYPG